MAIFYIFSTTSNHFHPLQVENCGSNSRLVVNEDDNGKFRPERVKSLKTDICWDLNLANLTNFQSLEVVDRGSETLLQVTENLN